MDFKVRFSECEGTDAARHVIAVLRGDDVVKRLPAILAVIREGKARIEVIEGSTSTS